VDWLRLRSSFQGIGFFERSTPIVDWSRLISSFQRIEFFERSTTIVDWSRLIPIFQRKVYLGQSWISHDGYLVFKEKFSLKIIT